VTAARRRYQREVERLLAQIQQQASDLRRLTAAGLGGRPLAERRQRLERTRRRLAETISASPAPDRRHRLQE